MGRLSHIEYVEEIFANTQEVTMKVASRKISGPYVKNVALTRTKNGISGEMDVKAESKTTPATARWHMNSANTVPDLPQS
jgi:hypothetical protein